MTVYVLLQTVYRPDTEWTYLIGVYSTYENASKEAAWHEVNYVKGTAYHIEEQQINEPWHHHAPPEAAPQMTAEELLERIGE